MHANLYDTEFWDSHYLSVYQQMSTFRFPQSIIVSRLQRFRFVIECFEHLKMIVTSTTAIKNWLLLVCSIIIAQTKFYANRVNIIKILVTHVEFRCMARLTGCVTQENVVKYGKVVYSLG